MLLAKRPWLRKLTGVLLIGMGIYLLFLNEPGVRGWLIAAGCNTILAGLWLWTRYWETAQWHFFLGWGSNSIARGLSEHNRFTLVIGVLLVSFTALFVLVAAIQTVLRNRAARRRLTTEN